MVFSLPLLFCELSACVKENPGRKKADLFVRDNLISNIFMKLSVVESLLNENTTV